MEKSMCAGDMLYPSPPYESKFFSLVRGPDFFSIFGLIIIIIIIIIIR